MGYNTIPYITITDTSPTLNRQHISNILLSEIHTLSGAGSMGHVGNIFLVRNGDRIPTLVTADLECQYCPVSFSQSVSPLGSGHLVLGKI